MTATDAAWIIVGNNMSRHEQPRIPTPIRMDRLASHLGRVRIGTSPRKSEILPEITKLYAFK